MCGENLRTNRTARDCPSLELFSAICEPIISAPSILVVMYYSWNENIPGCRIVDLISLIARTE